MTKFILVGGYPHKASDGGKAFCVEVAEGFGKPVKLLECLFSRPRDNWQKAFDQDKEFFASHLGNDNVGIQMAEPEIFIEQLRWANAIYFRDGDPFLLIETLNEIGNWQKELAGKTVAGSSAGADMISKYYYHLDKRCLGDGLGFLPVKVLVHYKSDYNAPNIDWDKVYTELKNYKENLPLLTLSEGQFEVRTV